MDEKEKEQCWRLWVDTERRIVSFHEVPDGQLLEFHSRELFLRCADEYRMLHYRYQ